MAHFKDPTLAPGKAIPERVYAAIANAQLEHHPFKDGRAALNDLMAVMHEIRSGDEDGIDSTLLIEHLPVIFIGPDFLQLFSGIVRVLITGQEPGLVSTIELPKITNGDEIDAFDLAVADNRFD